MPNLKNFYRFFQHNSKGFSLIEVMIAMALLGIIVIAFLGAISTASMALIIADERATAESLARSQMEYVKNQEYNSNEGGEGTYEEITPIPDGYSIWSFNGNNTMVEDVVGVCWNNTINLPAGEDTGLQRIMLVIKRDDNEIITLENYKVDR